MSEYPNKITDRVMDWHDQIFIPTHLRHSVGMDPTDELSGDDHSAGLLILRDYAVVEPTEA
jgi:hypothetical protein